MRSAASDQQLLELQHTLYASKNPTRRWLHSSRRDWILDAIRFHKTHSMQCALEIGPGSGVYLPTLASLFDTVVAADIASAFLVQARHLAHNHTNIKVIEDDIVRSTFSSGSDQHSIGFNVGMKPGDRYAVPLCTACHAKQHRVGELTFWSALRFDPLNVALRLRTVSFDVEAGERTVFRARQQINPAKAYGYPYLQNRS